jgi:3-methyladenine DNA glycosylase AlkD
MSLDTMKTSTASAGNLKYFSDEFSYIIELNLESGTKSFYVVWAENWMMRKYTYLN